MKLVVMFCPDCGREISNNTKFCGSCGYKVPNTETVVEPESVVESDVEAIPRRRGVGEGPTKGPILTILYVLKWFIVIPSTLMSVVAAISLLGILFDPEGFRGTELFLLFAFITIPPLILRIIWNLEDKVSKDRDRDYYHNKK